MDTTTYPMPPGISRETILKLAEEAGDWHPAWLGPSRAVAVVVLHQHLNRTHHRVINHRSGISDVEESEEEGVAG